MFELKWVTKGETTYQELEKLAETAFKNRKKKGGNKASKIEGLFKQVYKTANLLMSNPRHPGLNTHEYNSITHPFDPTQKIFEAYAQNNTPAAYRIFWCYGPKQKQITIIDITQHP